MQCPQRLLTGDRAGAGGTARAGMVGEHAWTLFRAAVSSSRSLGVFSGLFVLLVFVDYVELLRSAGGRAVSASTVAQTSFCRVPQLLER